MKQLLIASGLALTPAMTQAQSLANGLLNYWALDGDGLDTAGDYTGSASTVADNLTPGGTVDAATITASDGLFGGSGLFQRATGTDGRLAASQSDDVNAAGEDLSISLWVQYEDEDAGWQALLGKGEGANYRIAVENGGDGTNQYSAGYAGGTGDVWDDNGINIQDGTWHHIVATTTNGGGVQLYVDSVLEGNGAGPATINDVSPGNELFIGNNAGASTRMWDGRIDDVAMWNRVLTPAEIDSIFNVGSGGNALSTILQDNDDDDNDGLPNSWEVFYGLDPDDDGSVNVDNGPDGDPDMDNVSNLDEFNNGTFPNDADSDDDTLNDDVETDTGTWNSDMDRGTDPLDADSDDDGLRDDYENNDDTYVSPTQTGTDPNVADSDTDTIPDGYESDNGLDPNADDAGLDPDADTLTNLQEYLGRDATAGTGDGTNPQDDDTDSDEIRDDRETNTGTYLSDTDTGTDPLNPDTDGDTLLDGYETNNGTNSFVSDTDTGTNPLITDTDGDGTHDGAEVVGSRDPTVADNTTSGLKEKLLAYWNFDNNLDDIAHNLSSDSMVADNGVFTGPENDVFYAAEGLYGPSALEQTGGDGWVTVNSSVDTLRRVDNAVSVSAWVKVNTLTANWQTIICHGEGSQWRMARRSDQSVGSWAGGNTDLPTSDIGTPIDDTMWHHIVGVSDPVAGSTSIYVDGVLVESGGAPNIVDEFENEIPDLFIGANSQRANREWNGQLDDIAVWGRGLTQEEVTTIHEAGVSLEVLLGGGATLRITDISFDPSVGINGQFSITFTSRQNVSYALYMSDDLVDWGTDVDDDITGGDGTTTVTFLHPDPGNNDLFFRVEPN